jgi:hypothetical protein
MSPSAEIFLIPSRDGLEDVIFVQKVVQTSLQPLDPSTLASPPTQGNTDYIAFAIISLKATHEVFEIDSTALKVVHAPH